MHCRTARTWIIAARDGELDARRRHGLDRHLQTCAGCRAERVALEGVLAALDRLPGAAEVPARLEADVLRQVRGLAASDDRPAGATWLRRTVPALAATAVVALAVVGVRTTETPRPAPESRRIAAPAAPSAESRPRVAAQPAPERERPAVARRAEPPVPAEPPAELASRPDLFVDLALIRELDKVEHFDAIAAMDEGAPASEGEGPPPTNG